MQNLPVVDVLEAEADLHEVVQHALLWQRVLLRAVAIEHLMHVAVGAVLHHDAELPRWGVQDRGVQDAQIASFSLH